MISNNLLREKVLQKLLVDDFSNEDNILLSSVCILDNVKKTTGKRLPYLDVKFLRGQSEETYKEDGFEVNTGDLVILVDGENSGEIFEIPCQGYMGSTFKKLRISDEVVKKYIMYFIALNKELLKGNKTGAAIPHLNKKLFTSLKLHVPKKELQNEIVDKIDSTFELLNQKEKNDQDRIKLKEVLKERIIDSAIHGTLVENGNQDSSDLIEYIKKERKKYSLKESTDKINNSAIEFDIPKNWNLIELYQLYNFIDYRGMTPNKISEGVPLITATNIRSGYLDMSKKDYITEEDYDNRLSRGETKMGDLLFTTEAPMGNCAINTFNKCSTGQRIITFQTYGDSVLCNKLFMYFINSKAFQQEIKDNATGVTATGIKASKLKKMLIPVPPLEEQKRIVEKIESLFELIEQL